jgi:predicted transcriptional regulator YdeE
MKQVEIKSFQLIGLALKTKTSNENGQSGTDCGNLWHQFLTGDYANKIPGKLSKDIYAVYHSYEGDHTMPFAYFLGCQAETGTPVPDGLDSLFIPGGKYQLFIAKGEIPDCITIVWKEIWKSGTCRSYKADFEVYNERSNDLKNAEVEIYVSTSP